MVLLLEVSVLVVLIWSTRVLAMALALLLALLTAMALSMTLSMATVLAESLEVLEALSPLLHLSTPV